MKLAPLQLEAYFATEVTYRANPEFAAGQPFQFDPTHLDVETGCLRLPDNPDRWQATLRLKFQPPPAANPPCYFAVQFVGIVWTAPTLPPDRVESLVRTNGSSMLYGIARELVRDLSARGPFGPILLPSLSFLPDADRPDQPAPSPPACPSGSPPTGKRD